VSSNLFARLEASIVDGARTAIKAPGRPPLTYADLVALTGRMANVLVGLGVKPGDRVAAQVEKSVEALILYLATVRAGAVYLPLNSAYTLNELGYFIGDAEPALVVCDPASAGAVAGLAEKVGGRV
jgi:malonyl-CoA/methylmalonyl-CoA synthetase